MELQQTYASGDAHGDAPHPSRSNQNPPKNPTNPTLHRQILKPRSSIKQPFSACCVFSGQKSFLEVLVFGAGGSDDAEDDRRPPPQPQSSNPCHFYTGQHPISLLRPLQDRQSSRLSWTKQDECKLSWPQARCCSTWASLRQPKDVQAPPSCNKEADGEEQSLTSKSVPIPHPLSLEAGGTPRRSYAQVVLHGRPCSFNSDRLQTDDSDRSSPERASRRTKVRFASAPIITTFWKDSPPVVLDRALSSLRPVLSTHGIKPSSILRKSLTAQQVQKKQIHVESPDGKFARPSPPTSTLPLVGHVTQDEQEQQGWQLVRRRRWRRHGKKKLIYSSLPASVERGRAFFKNKTAGRCFNCLAFDHQVVQCRDPTRCWRFKGSGHISSRCTSRTARLL